MKKGYIFGAIHIYGQEYLPVYKHLMKICHPYFDELIGTYPDFWDSKEPPREFYGRTVKSIIDCDLFICEATVPSTGAGMELQMAQEHNIPCIALCQHGKEPSSMVKGIPCVQEIIYYNNLQDLTSQLEASLTKRQRASAK